MNDAKFGALNGQKKYFDHGWMNGQMDGQMDDIWMDGWMDG